MSNVPCVSDLLTLETFKSGQATQEKVFLDFPQSVEAQTEVQFPVSSSRFLQHLF
jgi:hypothetical protein